VPEKMTTDILLNPEEVEHHMGVINEMTHRELVGLWRGASPGHPYFDDRFPYYERFSERLFTEFGGITPKVSKQVGWN